MGTFFFTDLVSSPSTLPLVLTLADGLASGNVVGLPFVLAGQDIILGPTVALPIPTGNAQASLPRRERTWPVG